MKEAWKSGGTRRKASYYHCGIGLPENHKGVSENSGFSPQIIHL